MVWCFRLVIFLLWVWCCLSWFDHVETFALVGSAFGASHEPPRNKWLPLSSPSFEAPMKKRWCHGVSSAKLQILNTDDQQIVGSNTSPRKKLCRNTFTFHMTQSIHENGETNCSVYEKKPWELHQTHRTKASRWWALFSAWPAKRSLAIARGNDRGQRFLR